MSALSSLLASEVSVLANQPAPLVLGSLTLTGAEAPSRIIIGGKQLAAIHKLPGGARIIDAMGPDDNAIVWQGIFIGPTAASRVRQVDAMRCSGQSCMLAFADYLFDVIVVDLQYSYESRGAVISYRVRVEKTQTVIATSSSTALESALLDCAFATQLLTNTHAAIAAYGGLSGGLSGSTGSILGGVLSTVGSSASTLSLSDASGVQAQSASALSPAAAAIQDSLPLLSTGNLSGDSSSLTVASGSALISVMQSAGALASVVSAGGFINRATVNLATADAETVSIGVHS